MANPAPSVNINVAAVGSNPNPGASTGVWFALGVAHGPSGVAISINSLSDFNNYFGQIVSGSLIGRYTVGTVSSAALYDALDVYFREGGVNAYVSRVVGATSVVAASAASKWTLTAAGGGTWANSSSGSAAGLIMTVSNVSGVYTAVLAYNGVTLATSPALYSDLDVVNWINSLGKATAFCTATYSAGGTSVLPSSGSSVSVYLTGGTDVAPADSDIDAALAAFADTLGPGQVSYPGSTTTLTYSKLTAHAKSFNRVAFLDAVDGAGTDNSASIATAVATLQGTSGIDASYAAMFAPWLVVPGLTNANASTAGVVFSRTVAPSALAAARCSANDRANDCNVPAAGQGAGSSTYAINITVPYSATARATLNNAGVSVIRNVPNIGQIVLYGFRSCSSDPNWVYLNNVRMRMQMVRDFDVIGEQFVFNEIDGKGQVFAQFGGAIAGRCQTYYSRGSLYGATAGDAYIVNVGPQVNTNSTIAAGQMNANVSVRLSPFGEFVNINLTKYTTTASLPNF